MADLVSTISRAARPGGRPDAIDALRTHPIDEIGAVLLRHFAADYNAADTIALVREAGITGAFVAWLAANPGELLDATELAAALGPDAARLVPAYAQELDSSETWRVEKACHALGGIGAVDDEAIAKLRAMIAGIDEARKPRSALARLARRVDVHIDHARLAASALAGIVGHRRDVLGDLIAALHDPDLASSALKGIERYGETPVLVDALRDADPLVAIRTAAAFQHAYPRELVAAARASADAKVRAAADDAVIALASRFEEAATALVELVLGPELPRHDTALRAIAGAKLDDATRIRVYQALRARPEGFAKYAAWCLPASAFRYDADLISADGKLGLSWRQTSDRTSYRESDQSFEVVVFDLDTRRVLARDQFSVSEDAHGRSGSAPKHARFDAPGTVVIELDDGTTSTLRYQS